MTNKNNRTKNDHLKFPSGRTIKRCKEDAKALRKKSKDTDNYLSYNKALNIIAVENGLDMLWDKAINHIQNQQEVEQPNGYDHLVGMLKNERSQFKKEVHCRFEVDGKLMLPDGEGGLLEVFQHKSRNYGILITSEVAALVESDIEKMGGLENLKGYEQGNIQILYEKPNSSNHLAYEFHLNGDGVIHYFCRCMPWEGYQAELHVRDYSITDVGYGKRPVDTALHWLGFSMFHWMLTPQAM